MDKTVLQQIDELHRMSLAGLRKRWADLMGGDGGRFSRAYLVRRLAYRVQELAYGGLSQDARRQLKQIAAGRPIAAPGNIQRKKLDLADGTRLIREWHGDRYEVLVRNRDFLYNGQPYRSLTAIARAITGSAWNGNIFFGLTPRKYKKQVKSMTPKKPTVRCAIYTRKSHEEGLDQDFNSLDAQRAAAEAFIESQKQEGWQCLRKRYDDGGFTGGNMDRPALKELLADIEGKHVDCVVVYKVDRLSRSLLDFARLIDVFDQRKVAFVSVTQHFNTSTPMGRLVLNILLSFAQFERELTGERIRDKKLATARQGKYVGGLPPFGYDVVDRKYVVNKAEAPVVRRIFEVFVETESYKKVAKRLNAEGFKTKCYAPGRGGSAWTPRRVEDVLVHRIHIGQIEHKGKAYPGEHEPIIPVELFERVQAILHATGEARDRGKPYLKHWTLLRGIMRCGHCGALMRSSSSNTKGRQYRYYVCGTKISKSYNACSLPAIACGEIDKAVVDQMRAILRQPEMIARTYRAACEQANAKPDEAAVKRLQDLRDRQRQTLGAIRAVLASGQEGEFIASELARLNGELNALGETITQAETQPVAGPVDVGRIGEALRNIEPLWESLFPAEQERIVRLLIERITITTGGLDICFRANGIEKIVDELKPVEVLKRA